MLKLIALVLLSFSQSISAFSLDSSQLANNKEVTSRIVTSKQDRLIRRWVGSSLRWEEMRAKASMVLKEAVAQLSSSEIFCDVGFVTSLRSHALSSQAITTPQEFWNFILFLRIENLIDDILLANLIESSELVQSLDRLENHSVSTSTKISNRGVEDLDLKELYRDFLRWPDEVTNCSVSSFNRLVSKLRWKNKKELNSILFQTNNLAFKENVIDLETFQRLEIFRLSSAHDWDHYLGPYMSIVTTAKDKLAPRGIPQNDPSTFSSKYAVRRQKLTQRGRLYRQFNSTQVIMLADIINKTAKRMDAHYVAINFRYENATESESEIYVLSPMERYRLSIKMLRKDLGEVMRSDLFKNTGVEYEDLVAAAFETGLIKSDELEMILRFEHFWNPKQEKWKVYTDFAFSILGTSAFYLPPPYSIIGAIALVITQTQIDKKQSKPDEDENWNVVI